jgi:hypothetical protein
MFLNSVLRIESESHANRF